MHWGGKWWNLTLEFAILPVEMTRGQKRLRATLTLLGTIIGAGVFGVPAMMGAWGVVAGSIGFWLLALLVLGVHLLLAEAVSAYRSQARVAGLARHWLGPWAGAMTGMAQTLQVFGGNLAYIILGGEFLNAIALMVGFHLPVLVWQTLFWVAGGVVVFIGLGWMARIEAFLTWLLVGVMLLIIMGLIGRMDPDLLIVVAPKMTFEPYGVFLFSLFGMTIIPELEQVVSGRREDLRIAVMRGTLIAALLTYVFGMAAWLASSGVLGRSAADLIGLLPPVLTVVVPIFGFLAIATSYITTAFDLDAMFRVDYHFKRWTAQLVALGVPIGLLFLTNRDFLSTIGLVGSLFSGAVAVSCAFMGRAALRETKNAQFGETAWWWQEAAPAAIVGVLIAGGVLWLFVV